MFQCCRRIATKHFQNFRQARKSFFPQPQDHDNSDEGFRIDPERRPNEVNFRIDSEPISNRCSVLFVSFGLVSFRERHETKQNFRINSQPISKRRCIDSTSIPNNSRIHPRSIPSSPQIEFESCPNRARTNPESTAIELKSISMPVEPN